MIYLRSTSSGERIFPSTLSILIRRKIMGKIFKIEGNSAPRGNWFDEADLWCSNVYIIQRDRTAYIIDTGIGKRMHEKISGRLSELDEIKCIYLINTHRHLDHIANGGIIGELRDGYLEAHSYIYERARLSIESLLANPQVWPSMAEKIDIGYEYLEWLKKEDMKNLDFERVSFKGWKIGEAYLLYTPGHSSCSICIYLEEEEALFTGDLLWYVNPNLPSGNIDQILDSVAKVKELVKRRGIEYLGNGHLKSVKDNDNVLKYIEDWEEKERYLFSKLEELIGSRDKVTIEEYLDMLRGDDHPLVQEALRINAPFWPSSLENFAASFLRIRGWNKSGDSEEWTRERE